MTAARLAPLKSGTRLIRVRSYEVAAMPWTPEVCREIGFTPAIIAELERGENIVFNRSSHDNRTVYYLEGGGE